MASSIIQIPAIGKNIKFEDFNKVFCVLKRNFNENQIEIKYPSFVKPYVVSLVKIFLEENKNIENIKIDSNNNKVLDYLNRIRAHDFLTLGTLTKRDTMFPYRIVTNGSIYNEFATFLKKANISMLDEIISNIGELGENSIEHAYSNSDDSHFRIIAQYYPHIKRLEICLSDLGEGIARKVFNHFKKIISEEKMPPFEVVEKKVFQYAFNDTFTTREGGKGGQGLKNLLEKSKGNSLKLVIVTNNHYYDIASGRFNAGKLEQHFNGTLINLTFEF